MRPKALDLFCGAGGVALGLDRAGFEVIGVDINPQPRYPFRFFQADAIEFPLHGFDFIWASPPCQGYSVANNCQKKTYPMLVEPVRERLSKHTVMLGEYEQTVPYVIENVPGAPLKNPITLCGMMFGLKTYRHRLFESNKELREPTHHPKHEEKAARGRKPGENDFMTVFGHFSDQRRAKEAMGIPWMTRDELGEAIPPVYAEFIGRQILNRPSHVLLYK